MIRNDPSYCAFFRAALRLVTADEANVAWNDFADHERNLLAIDVAEEILTDALALADMAAAELKLPE